MTPKRPFQVLLVLALVLSAVPALAQQPATSSDPTTADQSTQATSTTTIASGKKTEIEGVVIRRDADGFILRDRTGADVRVMLTDATKVKERKSNPFRGAKTYAVTQLLRGLNLEVKGRGDDSGNLIAEEVKFREADLEVAQSIETRVTPVEGRLSSAEENARRMSGQLEELTEISNAARGGAVAAQQTADQALTTGREALTTGRQAHERVGLAHQRITALDEYEPARSVSVNFKVGSAVLSDDAKAALDQIADEAKRQKGYVIEVAGFASADGDEAFNRRLSWRRADAVVQYLAENHDVPLRRIVTPMGYGEKRPVADNTTREGRQQNRRVEVTVLVNKGITSAQTFDRPFEMQPTQPGMQSQPATTQPAPSTPTTDSPSQTPAPRPQSGDASRSENPR